MPEATNPDDINAEDDITAVVEQFTVTDVVLSVEALQLTVDMVLRLLRVFVAGVCFILLTAILASML
jgi:hypothetical protein